MRVHQPRANASNRIPEEVERVLSAQSKTFISPIEGWVSNSNMAVQPETSAVVLQNFWPVDDGIEPRGGLHERFDLGSSVASMFEYTLGGATTLFAATATDVYPFTVATVDGTVLTSDISGQTSGEYCTLQNETSGGNFLTIVNGTDHAQLYDGVSWQQVTDVSSPIAITGVSTSTLSYVWNSRNRQFFIQDGTLDAWYLGINSVGGTANKIPLAGVFNKGGVLLFGSTISSDSGDGMDDRCVFITDQGEAAIYSGGDPGNVNDWSLVGVYDVGTPINKNAHFKVSGDLVILTRDGLVPISSALSTDESKLKLKSYLRPIQPDWDARIAEAGSSSDWSAIKVSDKNMALVTPPSTSTEPTVFVVNLRTERTAEFTGWNNISTMAGMGGNIYVGRPDGKLLIGDTGGQDSGLPFVCKCCWGFSHLGKPGAVKTANRLKAVIKYATEFNAQLSVASNYTPDFPTAPNAAAIVVDGDSAWDVSLWDVDLWSYNSTFNQTVDSTGCSVGKSGTVLAPQLQITSSSTTKLTLKVVSVDLLYQEGAYTG